TVFVGGDDEIVDEAACVPCLMTVRSERRLRLEPVDVSALRVRPETALVVAEQTDHEVPAQLIGVLGVALVPRRVLSIGLESHETECVGAEPQRMIVVL